MLVSRHSLAVPLGHKHPSTMALLVVAKAPLSEALLTPNLSLFLSSPSPPLLYSLLPSLALLSSPPFFLFISPFALSNQYQIYYVLIINKLFLFLNKLKLHSAWRTLVSCLRSSPAMGPTKVSLEL